MNSTPWDYTKANYSTANTNMDDKTKSGIFYLYKDSDKDKIKEFLYWLNSNEPTFMYQYRYFIFSRLVEFKHFEISDDFLAIKPFKFDEEISRSIVVNTCMVFEEDILDYWLSKVKTLEPVQQNSIYKNFWPEFFTYHFLRNKDFSEAIQNLPIAFKKIPFYGDNDYESFILSRKESFSKEVPSHLNTNNQDVLFHAIGLLCGQYYLDSKDVLKTEFANYPMAMKSLNSFFLNEKLEDSLPVKKHSSKNKL